MVELITQHRSEIEALCRKYLITRLELFGSATDAAEFDPASSDVDFLYDIDVDAEDLVDRHFGFHEAMESLLGRRVDLVSARQIRNPFFLQAVNEQRVMLYAA